MGGDGLFRAETRTSWGAAVLRPYKERGAERLEAGQAARWDALKRAATKAGVSDDKDGEKEEEAEGDGIGTGADSGGEDFVGRLVCVEEDHV